MSQERVPYNVRPTTPKSLAGFKRRACTKVSHAGYQAPTAEEVRILIELAGWSQSEVAKLVGVHYSAKKGSSTVRKWKTDEDKSENREIPYSAWRLLLIYAGVATIEDALKLLKKG